MDTRTYIRDNYDRLLRKARTMRNFDEDVFQNTMLYLILNSDRFTEETIHNYVIHALKINFIRERQYSRNKTTEVIPDGVCYSVETVDVVLIQDLITERFGKDLCDCYKLHCDGYTLNEIKQRFSHIKNLRNKIKTIEGYTRDIILN